MSCSSRPLKRILPLAADQRSSWMNRLLARALLTAEIGIEARNIVEVSLCVDLYHRYRRLGSIAIDDLEEAIRLGRGRVEAGNDVSWVTDRVNLASALLTSWEDRDRAAHLNEVIDLLQPALTSDEVGAESLALIAVNLAAAYGRRYDHIRRPADLERAIQVLRIAVTGPAPACIGCGCLSLKRCAMSNPADLASADGSGARYLPAPLR
jgi:hypothetical protein